MYVYHTVDLNAKGFSIEVPIDSFDVPVGLIECDQAEMERFKNFVTTRQRPLLPDVSITEEFQYINPSKVILKYLDLHDSLIQLLQCVPHKEILKVFRSVVASDTYDIKYFSPDFMKTLENCSTTSLLRILFPYTNWYDHSIVRELVEACDCPEGVKLLDEFDSRIDVTQPITAYPIPAPSSFMNPSESSTHTVMAVSYEKQLSSLSLQHIEEMKLDLMRKFGITEHACVLLAIENYNSATIYWLIPSNIVALINGTTQEQLIFLPKSGLLAVDIYPNFLFSTGGTIRKYHGDTGSDLKHVRNLCMYCM